MSSEEHFREEYMALKEGRELKCSCSSLATLSPILTDGIIRIGGRIYRAPIAFEAAHPVIPPKSSPVFVLIARYYRHVLGHAGREHVLSVLRQRYWILRGRALVRQILSKCVRCRKRKMPALQRAMVELPKERLVLYHPRSPLRASTSLAPSMLSALVALSKCMVAYSCALTAGRYTSKMLVP